MLGKLLDLVGGAGGLKVAAIAAGIAFLAGNVTGWKARDLFAEAAENERLIRANESLQEALFHKEREQIANSNALERVSAAEAAAQAELDSYRERLRHADPSGDCKPAADRQPLVDGLR